MTSTLSESYHCRAIFDPDVGLVLMVGEDDLDLHALGRRAKIFHRHPRRHHRALSGEVRVEARLVVQHADLDDPVGDLRLRAPAASKRARAPITLRVNIMIRAPFQGREVV
jgi:hypothetical protein